MATEEIMTPEVFREKMLECSLIKRPGWSSTDTEWAHQAGDELMCDLLESLGYTDGIKVFLDMERWYS